jgi:UDP-glucose 4-epimerase
VIPNFITAALSGTSPVVYGDGRQSRDFTYVDNVVDANLLAVDARVRGEIFNVACGQRISLNAVIDELSGLTATSITPTYLAPRSGDIRHSLADVSLAEQRLGYSVRVAFDEGLRQTFEHYAMLGATEEIVAA